MAAVGRNQPCPCGSGKRYKECHGAIEAVGVADVVMQSASADLSWVPHVMQAALRAQQSGRGREAASGYRRVLAVEPANFDATHMLALVEYECGRYDSAIALLRRAIELRPEIAIARHNLRLLESMPRIEEGICREILPRLMARVEPVSDVARFASSASRIHLVLVDDANGDERAVIERLRRAFAQGQLELWGQTGTFTAVGGARFVEIGTGVQPEGGVLALVGTSRSQAAWLGGARAERVLLVVVRDEPCAIIDRIDEVTLLADAKPGIVCATLALAERLGLPRDAALAETGH
jgi:tetratricopeptide (TPR) repeat protein